MLRQFLAMTLLLGAACTEDPDAPPAPASKQAEGPGRAAKGAARAIDVACAPTRDVPAATRDAIHNTATEVYAQLHAGDIETLWASLHPQARQPAQQAAFTQALNNMHRRLADASDEATLEHAFFVDVHGGVTDLARISCKDERGGLTLLANAGNEDVAVVTLLSDAAPFGLATTVQLRQSGKRWRVLGVNVGLASIRGKDAATYAGLADTWVSEQRVVEAYLALGVATQLAARGSSVKLDLATRIADKLDAVTHSQQFESHLGIREVGGVRYDIKGFGVAATQSDLSAVLKYVSPGGLIKEMLDREADALVPFIKMQYPQLSTHFDALILEAYDNAAESEEEVDAYRTPRFFDDTRNAAATPPVP